MLIKYPNEVSFNVESIYRTFAATNQNRVKFSGGRVAFCQIEKNVAGSEKKNTREKRGMSEKRE